jgi:hypothetical protein
MNSPCDFPETCHVGLTCENDRRLVTRMSKRLTLGSFLGIKSNPRPRSREIRSIPRVSPPSLGSGITLIGALQVQILTYYTRDSMSTNM